jgi:hypothetical protein
MPLSNFVLVPSFDTYAEDQFASYDDAEETVYYLDGYPYVSVFGDFDEFYAQTLQIHTPVAADRYLDRMGIFTTCSALDETTFTFLNVDSRCEFNASNS